MYGMFLYIMPPYLSIFYLFSDKIIKQHLYLEAICFIFASLFVAMFGYLLNDLFDIEIDKIARKKNIFIRVNNYTKALVVIIVITLADATWILSKPNYSASFLLLIEIALLVMYTAKPIRLKNHPILGPICDAHYSHILPVFITLSFLEVSLNLQILLLLHCLLLGKGIRNILLHQLDDRKHDKISAVRTFPNIFGIKKTLQIINFIILPLEIILCLILLLLFYPYSNLFLISFVLFIVFKLSYFSFWYWHKTSKINFFKRFIYGLNDFYEFWFPVICILHIGITKNVTLIILLLHIILFRKHIIQQFRYFNVILTNYKVLFRHVWSYWSYYLSGAN